LLFLNVLLSLSISFFKLLLPLFHSFIGFFDFEYNLFIFIFSIFPSLLISLLFELLNSFVFFYLKLLGLVKSLETLLLLKQALLLHILKDPLTLFFFLDSQQLLLLFFLFLFEIEKFVLLFDFFLLLYHISNILLTDLLSMLLLDLHFLLFLVQTLT